MRTMGQHIRDVFTLADKPQLLTDPDPTPVQVARIAESRRFYFILNLVFAIVWAAMGLRDLFRNQGDDKILAWVLLGSAFGMAYLARRHYEKRATVKRDSSSPNKGTSLGEEKIV